MKMLIISFLFWALIFPSLVGSFVLLTVLAASSFWLYFAVAWFLAAFAVGTFLCGPFWIIPAIPFLGSPFRSSPLGARRKTIDLKNKVVKCLTAFLS
jgi:hypothetical protein